jgi:putative tryptophan/tyrosine transport system substrate-binding protein
VIPVNRRTFLSALCIAALVPATARAQARKVYRVAILAPNVTSSILGAFIEALRERGWVVGRNLQVEIHDTKGDPARAEALAEAAAREGVDLIATNVTATAIAAHRATKVVPIVMLSSSFPVEGGLAESLARPGGNVTGVTLYAGSLLFGKFVELLHVLVPGLRELGVLWGYAPPSYKPEQIAPAIHELHRGAKALNIAVRFWQTGTERDLDAALQAVSAAPLDALLVTSGIIHSRPEILPRIVQVVSQQRLPVLTDFNGPLFTKTAVLAYAVDQKELAARAASLADRILKGAKPGELPIEQPAKYGLTVNLPVAKALGVTVPRSLLVGADRVIGD